MPDVQSLCLYPKPSANNCVGQRGVLANGATDSGRRLIARQLEEATSAALSLYELASLIFG